MSKQSKKLKERQYIKSPINNKVLDYKVYVLGKIEKIFVSLVAFIAGGLTGMVFYTGLFKVDGYATKATYLSNFIFFVAAGGIAIKLAMPIYRKASLEKRKNVLKLQFRDFLESLAASFSSGSNVHSSFESALQDLRMQYDDKDYIVKEVQEIVDGAGQNISIETMLKSFADRSGNDDILSFTEVFEICYRKGGNMKAIVNNTYHIISDKISISEEIETKLTSNKLQHSVMSVMPIAVVGLLRLTNESFAESFTTPVGVIVNTIAIGIFIAAYKYGNKIVDIKG